MKNLQVELTQPNMICGHPKKQSKTQNISGLHGQHQAPSFEDVRCHNTEEQYQNFTLASKFGIEEGYELPSDSESEGDEECEWDALEDEEFSQKLAEMDQREDNNDRDWILEWEWRKAQKAQKHMFLSFASCGRLTYCDTARPKAYKKGPDVMSKSARMQRRYKTQWKGQLSLDSFGFTGDPKAQFLCTETELVCQWFSTLSRYSHLITTNSCLRAMAHL